MLGTRTDIVVGKALDGMATRHRVYVNNIANVETPQFTPSDVPFEAELRRLRDSMAFDSLADTTEAKEFVPSELKQGQMVGRKDENGVAIDDQVVRLEENQLSYEALLQAARLRHDIMHSSITETAR